MNITEAQAAQTLLRSLTNHTPADEPLPTVEELTDALATLAERSSTALKTGITGEQARQLLATRRGYPYRLRAAVSR